MAMAPTPAAELDLPYTLYTWKERILMTLDQRRFLCPLNKRHIWLIYLVAILYLNLSFLNYWSQVSQMRIALDRLIVPFFFCHHLTTLRKYSWVKVSMRWRPYDLLFEHYIRCFVRDSNFLCSPSRWDTQIHHSKSKKEKDSLGEKSRDIFQVTFLLK